MKRLLYIFGGLIAILAVAIAAVPYLIPSEVYRTQVEKQAEAALNRDVTLVGEARLTIIPRIAVRIGGVSVANPEGFTGNNMIEAGELRARVKFLPLLAGRVEIAEISLVDANVTLERRADGKANWEFGADTSTETPATQSGNEIDTGVDSARLVNSSVRYVDAVAGYDYTVSELTARASMQALDQPVRFNGSGRFNGEAFELDLELQTIAEVLSGAPASTDVNLKTDLGSVGYDGRFALGETPTFDGAFELSTQHLAKLAALVGVDAGIELAEFGAISAKGTINGPMTAPKISFDNLELASELMTTDYSGGVSITPEFSLNGALNSNISDAGLFLTKLGIDGGPVSALEAIRFNGTLNGPLSSLTVGDAKLTHNGDLLDLDYSGDFALGASGKISGPLTVSSKDLRGLLKALGTELAPGETLQKFSLSGTLAGSPSNINISGLDLSLDNLSGTGSAGINLSGTVPRLTADLSMPALNLTPFLGESETQSSATTQASGWSTSPLALEGLRAVDADIKLKTGLLQIGKVELTNADVTATLTNGDLNTNINTLKAFGGDWDGTLTLDTSEQTPTMTIDMQGKNVVMQSVMTTFANLQTVSGTGKMTFNASSSGKSLHDLVGGLNGALSTDLGNGKVKGFNVAQIVRSLDSIKNGLSTGALGFALSPEAETDFTEFNSALTITNGVARIDLMRALNPAVLLDGSGKIDLLNQTIDVSITPSIDTHGAGDLDMLKLNGEPFPIPFRISGSWYAPGVTIDNGAITKELQARALGVVGERISDELGGDLGNIVGDAIGVRRKPSNPPAEKDGTEPANDDAADDTPVKDDADDPKSIEDELETAVEDLAKDALGDLFKRND